MEQREINELVKSETVLRAIIDTAIDGIVIIDKSGLIMTVNPAVCEIFGYEVHEMEGKNVNMLMGAPYHEEHDSYLSNYLRTGHAKIIGIGREVEGKRADGSIFPLRLAVSEIKFQDRHYFAGFIHDLTEVKRAQNEILKLNEELEQKVMERTEELQDVVNAYLDFNKQLRHEIKEREAMENQLRESQRELSAALEKEKELNELKSRFVSTASHEFRTPLSTILSSTALISRYTESEQQPQRDKHLKRIKSSVNTLNSILNDFLSLSKIEEGKILVTTEQTTLGKFCEDIILDTEGLLKKGQKIENTLINGDATFNVDTNILKNILFNLLSNAIKYSPEKSTIYCSGKLEDSRLTFVVRDEGIGIPESDQKHLFSRFFRASNATNIQGTGLGLNIVAGYVEMLNGNINFESEQDVGSTFTVIIPIGPNG